MIPDDPSATGPANPLVANLDLIERSVARVCGIHALPDSEVEEFSSWIMARMIEDDYAVFRKFEGRSSLATYLRVVISRMFVDYRNERWGRWRPSAAASRLGPLAVDVERMVYRDGESPDAALARLRARHTEMSPRAFRDLYGKLPRRWLNREVGVESAAGVATEAGSDGWLWAAERANAAGQIRSALTAAMASLAPEDQIIVRMRYWDEMSVADIARALRLDQKPLYRRLQVIHDNLRGALSTAGVSDELVATALSDPGVD